MSRRCELTAKGPQVGHKVSHSNIKTKHVQHPNLQPVRAVIDGVVRRIRACTRCLRSGRVVKAA